MNEETAIGMMKQSINEDVDVSEMKLLKQKSWLARHVNAVSGVACLVVAIVLFVVWIGHMKEPSLSFYETSVRIAVLVIALYCLLKGVFTLVFHAKTSAFEAPVHQFAITEAYNRLYFVYERMVWLWVLAPALLAVVPALFGMTGGARKTYAFVALAAFVVLLLAFGRPLARKRRQLKREIMQLKQLNN